MELAETIKSEGLLQPVLARPNGARGCELVNGERRLSAYPLSSSLWSFVNLVN